MNGLGCLIMTAVIDQSFRDRLLAAPDEAARDFELTEYERRAVASIHAGSFTEFADQLQGWLDESDSLEVALRRDEGPVWFEKEALVESNVGRNGFKQGNYDHSHRLMVLHEAG